MEDHQGGGQDSNNNSSSPPSHGSERNNNNSEPVRSRWTPKPEQILILESIFNSGMVNPPKDETVRIRRLLEKFGSVGDANVFYWFQNRRSRSRRRQRQIQASLAGSQAQVVSSGDGGTIIQYDQSCSSYVNDPKNSSFGMSQSFAGSSSCFAAGSSSSSSYGCFRNENGNNVDDYFGFPNYQMGFQEMETSLLCPSSDVSNMQQYQAGLITVFINGVPTEVPRGSLDIKALFGQDLILLHSSGIPVPTNDYGFSMQSLQHGESYFLVSRFS